MDPISIAIAAINGLRLVLNNPALGGGSSLRLDQASEVLGLLGTLLSEGESAYEELKALTTVIEDMAAAGRGPTRVEWDAMRARGQDAHDRLQAVKEELLEEDATPEPAPEAEPAPEETETGSDPESEPEAPGSV